jgi:uncharacterized protein YceK
MKCVFLTLATALLLAGCGGGSRHNSPTTQQTVTSTTTTAGTVSTTSTQQTPAKHNARKTLLAGVRAALLANHHLAIRVLWTNRVPTSAVHSTRGSALAGMRASARDRQGRGVRVRMVHDDYRIVSIALGPSLASATAVAQSIQTVVPSHLDGRPLGRSVRLNERARIVLRRLGKSRSFVVWRITLLK